MQVVDTPGSVVSPAGTLEGYRVHPGRGSVKTLEDRRARNAVYDVHNVRHPFSTLHFTEKGIDLLEQYIHEVREVIGYDIPLAIDHVGHISLQNGIRLARRIEKYVPAWLEDVIPWQYTDQYRQLQEATTVPICTGEDIYLKEGFEPLLRSGISVIHPDLLTTGGILETKKIGDAAQDHGIAMAIHMAESPIACMAAAHVAVATENFMALEYHSVEVDWWDDIQIGLPKPIVQGRFHRSSPTSRASASTISIDDLLIASTCSRASRASGSRPSSGTTNIRGIGPGAELMKITAIKPYPVWIGIRNQMLVKVETDDGIFGWGESGLSGREMAVAGALEHYSRFLIGKNAFDIGAIWQETYRSQYFEGGRVLQAAISAVDIALHDIKGKALGVPVYELLGGKQRSVVPAFASTGDEAEGDVAIERAKELLAQGFQAIRFFPVGQSSSAIFEPRESIARTAKMLNKARHELGEEVVLGIDYHHRLSVAESASFCSKLDKGVLDFLEEPIRDETPEAYESLRTMTDIPFAIGEEFASKWQFLPYIERGIHQFNRIDVCNVGGITEAMKVAGWSEAHYVDLMPHNPLGPICTAATVHMAAAVPNFAWLETRAPEAKLGFDNSDFFPVQPRLDGASYPVSDAPGLGVEVNEELVKKQSFKFWEAPHLKRRDGSVTNW